MPEPTTPAYKLPNWSPALLFALLALLLYAVFILSDTTAERRFDIPYTRFKQLVSEGRVVELELSGYRVQGRLTQPMAMGPDDENSALFRSRLPVIEDPSLLPLLEEQGVSVTVHKEQEEGRWATLLVMLLPWLVFIGLFYWIMQRTYKRMSGGLGAGGEL